MIDNRVFTLGAAGLLLAAQIQGAPASGVVATGHPVATDAATQTMRAGGNAVDGAVAAALTLGVVDGHNSGIGGGCFMLIRRGDGSVIAIDGRETAPAAATRNMYVRNGRADSKLSQTGAIAVGTPGALAAYDYALRHFGRFSLSNHLWRASHLAEQGFQVNHTYEGRLRATQAELQSFDAARSIFLRPDGSLYRVGDMLRQIDLANTYRKIASGGIDAFYRGFFAEATERCMERNNGLLKKVDFEEYQAKTREPVRTTYRGYEIVGFPPPSSGGVHVAQILNIIETFDLRKFGQNSADFVHVLTEAMKLAFADRAHWLGDPDFVAVPRGLIAKEYATNLAKTIRMTAALTDVTHGTPLAGGIDIFSKHTTHFSVADAEGNWVACTATINTSFGSKVVVPGTGVVLNNQMDDFSAQPGTANFFGLIGSDANAIAPGKRPLSSMSPTIVLKNDQPVLCVGAAGGPTIISQTLLAIVGVIDFGLTPEAALAQPRFHHQWQPDELRLEKQFSDEVAAELSHRGHHVRRTDSIGAAQAVGFAGGEFRGAADPRGEGKATSW